MIASIFTIIPVLLGVLLIGAALWEFMSWKTRFDDWKDGMAISLGAVKKRGDVGPHLAYEYKIDGTSYEGRSGYMKDSLPKKGDSLHIYYDPADPSHSEWYDAGMHRFFMFATGLVGAGLIWMAIL